MAIVKETVKLYVIEAFGEKSYWPSDLSISSPEYYTCLGSVDAAVEYDEAELMDPLAAQLAGAEAALQKHRAEAQARENALIERIESLRCIEYNPEPGKGDDIPF